MEPAPSLVCEGLARRFGDRTALEGLTLDAQPGEVLALLGPNGAGKTTTVRLLNGVLRPDGGHARVLGLDPEVDGDEVRRRTGVLTEQSGLDDRLTALENVVAHARIRRIPTATAEARGLALLERFALADRAKTVVQGFSTGQRKRVALARALVHDPEVLFLDEPTSGLDPEGTRDTLDLIAGLAHERGRTVVLCTHFLAEAGRLCNRMAVLDHGRLLAFGTPADLAAGLWEGLGATVDLGGPAPATVLDAVRNVRGVLRIEADAAGAELRVTDREVVPAVVSTLTAAGIAVYGVVLQPATVEDVYFAVTGGSHR